MSVYKPANLPPELRLDLTIPQVMALRHESARTVYRKIASGAYRSHKNGDSRLIELTSVIEDRERCIALGPQLGARPMTAKRRPGRPKKAPAEDLARVPAE